MTANSLNATFPFSKSSTFVDLLRDRALSQSDQEGYCFLTDGETAKVSLSYSKLDQQARSIGALLQRLNVQGDRALLLYPPGLEYISAFFGCLYAGTVAIPAYPPRRHQGSARIKAIALNAQANIVLTTQVLLPDIQSCLSDNSIDHWITTESLESDLSENWYPPTISGETLAFLQYTSGSTGQPKGVKISHANLLHNSALIHQNFEHSSASKGVIWLPPYHDMGLIGGILQPLYGGFPVTLMSPVAFLQKPIRWLQAISQYQGTTSGAPNFAYEMCIQKTTPEQRLELDLSHWDIAFTGAEPVRADTLSRFAEAFSPCGFRPEAFYSCYGLAEATLWVTGATKAIAPRTLAVNREALQLNQVLVDSSAEGTQTFVSSGWAGADQQVAIVNPETPIPCKDNQVGEVWVAGKSMAQGYWNNKEATGQIFQAKLEGQASSFLRTGDLGFVNQRELFVTGRSKDIIIIRGRNYYPQDIEQTVEQSHAALVQGLGAAFSIEKNNSEELVVVHEVQRDGWRALRDSRRGSLNISEIITAIRSAISQQHQLQVSAVLLLKPGSIPKTSSGKVKRYACRDEFEKKTLIPIGQWQIEEALSVKEPQTEHKHERQEDSGKQVHQLINWLRDYATHHINSRLIDERRSIAPHIVLDFGNQGLLGMQVPSKYGGIGLGNVDTMRVLEQLGAIDPTLALFVGLNNVLGIRPILSFGTEDLCAKILPTLATGRELAAFALTEPAAGSNPHAMVSQAIAHNGGWQLNGHKIWSGSAAWAGVINVFVQHQNDPTQGISGFAVRRGAKGLRQGAEALTMGMRGMVQNAVHLEQVAVTNHDLLGSLGGGMTVAQDAMMYGRLTIAAACVGGMKRCAQLMLRYSSRRSVATGRLLDNPVTLSRLSYLNAAITAVEALVQQIAQQLDAGLIVPIEAYTACKTAAPEFYWQAADWLVQTLGGRGYIETNLAPQILRDARVLRIFEGPTETLNLFLGSRVIHQRQDLQTWLSQGLNAPEIAQKLFAAAEQIGDRPTPFTDPMTANRWAASQIGELATWAILWAALKRSPDAIAARLWAEQQFQQKLSQALTASSNLVVATANDIENEICHYENAIGDIEQTLPGEDNQLDDLLRKDVNHLTTQPPESQSVRTSDAEPVQTQFTSEAIQAWLVQWLSQKLKIPINAIDRRQSFADYGIDSVVAVELAQDLETWLNLVKPLDATIAWNFPTLEALANHLAAAVPDHVPVPAQTQQAHPEAIAIIGMDCRFPGGANSPEGYWNLLQNGVDAISEIPGDRWDLALHYDSNPEAPGKMYTRFGGFIDQVDQFDPQFFGISPREAISMDPQQRLLLEVSYTALERAGQAPEQLKGSSTGVFIGISFDDYAKRSLHSNDLTRIDAYSSLGNTRSIAVGRIAYALGLQGPVMQVDTTCSSSLLAVHLACQSLRSGESNLALAGGVSLILAPEPMVGFCKLKALSVDGRCKTFDANADGYSRGEGCGVLVLKRLTDAIAHQDQILAIISGSAVNHDGQSNGLTAPNGSAQTAVIRQAVMNSGIEPNQIQYVEAHGTGTSLGDPIEILALNQALGEGRSQQQSLMVGSVKTNFGHLESAAGVASLIKVVLALQHRQIPPHLHFQQPNPYIPWKQLDITVPTQLTPWQSNGKRFAGVSSFGMSGTNAHVVLAEADEVLKVQSSNDSGHYLLTLSAKSAIALQELAQKYQQVLSTSPEHSLANICFTANTGRSHYEYRLAIVTQTCKQLYQQLESFIINDFQENVFVGHANSSSPSLQSSSLNLLDSLHNNEQTLENWARIYIQGAAINWTGGESFQERQRLVLPTYPFQRQRYWLEAPSVSQILTNQHPLLGQALNLAKLETRHFYNQLQPPAFLKQHCVLGTLIMPAAGLIEMALAAGAAVLDGSLEITNFVIQQALVIPQQTQIILTSEQDDYRFEIFSNPEQQHILHAAGNIKVNNIEPTTEIDLSKKQNECVNEISIAHFYQSCQTRGIEYGKDFQAIDKLWQGDRQALGHIRLPQHLFSSSHYHIHPVLLDAALQVVGAVLPDEQTYLPVSIEQFIYHQPLVETLWSFVELRSPHPTSPTFDIYLFNTDQHLCATLKGLKLQIVSTSKTIAPEDWLYQVEWRSQPLDLPYLLSPIVIHEQVIPQLSKLTTQPELVAYGQLIPQMERLSLGYVIQAFSSLSLAPQQRFTTAEISTRLNVTDQHQRLLTRLLEMLAEADIIQQQSDHWQVVNPFPEEDASTLLKTLQKAYPFGTAELLLLDRCGSQLASVLCGKTDPVELLFSASDLTALTQLYQNSPGARLMNTAVQQAVKSAISKKPTGSPLRILEIGAGTGSTTAYLLPMLDAVTTEYTFTDISPLFIIKAQDKFKDYSFVKYQTLDLERSPQSQGYSLQSYDIVLAANVIHATQDLQSSIAHVHQLLNSGGILILLEGVQPMRWLDLIFGLTEGWWRFTDSRTQCPLIDVKQWQTLLQSCGFETPTAIVPELEGAIVPQAIILGQVPASQRTVSQWLIFSDRQGIGESFAAQLRTQNQTVTQVFADEYYPDHSLNLQTLLTQSTALLNVLYLWSLDVSQKENSLAPQQLDIDTQWLCHSVLKVVQTLVTRPSTHLYLVTQAGVEIPHSDLIPAIAQSPIWGLGKVIKLEHPELNCRCIDLDPTVSITEQAQTLLAELAIATQETQVAWRQQERYVARLAKYQPAKSKDQSRQLLISQRGTLENLSFQSLPRCIPHPHQVEIRIHATGLNFRDVLNALGLYPGEAGLLGCECVGEVVAVGSAIAQFKLGDAVMAIASGSFSEYVTVDAAMVIHKPEFLSMTAAATIPVAFLTAFYGLHHLAKMKRGDRVLIHAAAGGVGQAAIQLAQQAGAEIFATASSGKWEALKLMGVQHIFNSRSLNFADQIKELTRGKGIDIVLNSLAGEFVEASLSVLKPSGCFVDLGKGQPPSLPDNIVYTQVDLVELCQQQPNLIQSMLQQIRQQFIAHKLQSLPYISFPIQESIQAFRAMQQARHVGKIVVTQNLSSAEDPVQPVQIHSDLTYLITGGLGGLGLLVADWLTQQGAKHLVLISRRSPTLQVNTKIRAWEQLGVQVRIVQADIAETHAMQQVLSDVEATMPTLRGVIHAAGVLDDGTLEQLTAEQMTVVLRPKIAGAWNLHTLVQQPLDFFVLFSSATALLGSPGQANHVAANTFLDALANYRRSIEKPALSINWGAWSEIGSAADRSAQMSLKGIGTIAPHEGMEIFAQLLQQNASQVGVMPMQWSTFLAQCMTDPFFTDFAHTKVAPSNFTPVFLQQLQAAPKEEQRSHLEQHIRYQIAQVLGCQATDIDAQKGFFDLGMDSLTSVELKNRLQASLNCSLSATLIFDYPTLDALLDYLAMQLINEPDQAELDQSSLTELSSENLLDELTQDELADLLLQELSETGRGTKR